MASMRLKSEFAPFESGRYHAKFALHYLSKLGQECQFLLSVVFISKTESLRCKAINILFSGILGTLTHAFYICSCREESRLACEYCEDGMRVVIQFSHCPNHIGNEIATE